MTKTIHETACPVTGEIIIDFGKCEHCTIGRVYACPVKQEIEEMEAHDAQEA